MNPVAKALNDAARLLKRKGWTRESYAVDVFGMRTGVASKTACAFCADGALMRVSGVNDVYVEAYQALRESIGENVWTWNDAQPDAETVISKLREVAREVESAS